MVSGTKFKILFELYRHDELKGFLVPFEKMDNIKNDHFNGNQNYILRSALKSETPNELNSGVGLSIKDIKNYTDFLDAKAKVLDQPYFELAIIQPYWEFDKHITLYWDEDTFYGDVIGQTNEFLIGTSVTKTGNKNILKSLDVLLTKLKKFCSGPLLLELGYKNQQLKIFQINEVHNKNIKKFIFEELFNKVAKIQKHLLANNFWINLKTEYLARKFRQVDPHFTLGNVLQNWLYLFHYFKIFCIRNKLHFGSESFEKFLNCLNNKGTILTFALWHLNKANTFRMTEDLPEVTSFFDLTGQVYLGNGRKTFVFGKNAICLEDLSSSQILTYRNHLILSTYNAILGHPCLLMAQENISFVGGLDDSRMSALKAGDEISVDFNLRLIEIKSS